jgi:hypothetical protein
MSKAYFNDPRLNASTLKLFSGRDFDPLVAVHKMRNPSGPTPAMALGTAVHSIVEHLGSTEGLIVSPYDNFRTKEAQLWKAEHPEYLTSEDLLKAERMASRILSVCDEAHSPSALREEEFYTDDYKALLDLVLDSKGIDYKTTAATSASQFERDCIKYGYALQAYHYLMVAELDSFEFIAVSSVEPHPVWRFTCAPDFIEYGKQQWHEAFERYTAYKDMVIEPSKETYELKAPPWAALDVKPTFEVEF